MLFKAYEWGGLLLAFLALCFTLLFIQTGKVWSQEAEPWRGIFCDSQAQIERVVSEGTKLGGAAEGIQAVNAKDGETACVVAVIIGVRGKAVATISTPEGLLDIIPFTVQAVATPLGLIPVEQKVWFTLAESKAREA